MVERAGIKFLEKYARSILYKRMVKIKLTCETCGLEFERCKSEHNRNVKKNSRTFCSRKCCGVGTLNNIPKESKKWDHLAKVSNADEFSPFRWHMRNIKRRSKVCTVTLNDIKEQWESQKGICPYTGWKLKNMKDTSIQNQLPKTPDRASLDRIDSSKGYVRENIEFVSFMAQCAKNEFDKEELHKFCEAVANKKSSVISD